MNIRLTSIRISHRSSCRYSILSFLSRMKTLEGHAKIEGVTGQQNSSPSLDISPLLTEQSGWVREKLRRMAQEEVDGRVGDGFFEDPLTHIES